MIVNGSVFTCLVDNPYEVVVNVDFLHQFAVCDLPLMHFDFADKCRFSKKIVKKYHNRILRYRALRSIKERLNEKLNATAEK